MSKGIIIHQHFIYLRPCIIKFFSSFTPHMYIFLIFLLFQFYEALGDGYDRNKMVQYCSRHRARDAVPDTPPDYWQMSFPSSETQDI
jgi:hypothetical protein